MTKSLILIRGVSTEEKFVKDFFLRLGVESLKSKGNHGWHKVKQRDRILFAV